MDSSNNSIIYALDGSTLEYLSPSLEKVEWQEWSWWSRARFQLWRDAAMLNPRRNSIIILHIYLLLLLMPSVRMATNDAADMCLSMKIPLLSLKVEDKAVRDKFFDITGMHLNYMTEKETFNRNYRRCIYHRQSPTTRYKHHSYFRLRPFANCLIKRQLIRHLEFILFKNIDT